MGCFLLCAVLGLAEGVTLYLLSKFAERYDAHTYSLLVSLWASARQGCQFYDRLVRHGARCISRQYLAPARTHWVSHVAQHVRIGISLCWHLSHHPLHSPTVRTAQMSRASATDSAAVPELLTGAAAVRRCGGRWAAS